MNCLDFAVADFGFASYMTEDVFADTLRGSPLYMAPEIICERKYHAKVDLWSVGVIMFGERFLNNETWLFLRWNKLRHLCFSKCHD